MSSLRLLWRNPDLLKVVAASGLLAAATIMSPAAPLVMIELRSRVWGEHMSSYTALFNTANGIVAMLFSGSFGRFGDKVGRRLAMNIVGVLGFMPTWSLLVFGCNVNGLAAFSVLTVVGGVACITVTGCPTCYALVSDVMAPEDLEVAFGICFAGVVAVAIIANFGGLVVSAAYEGRDLPILLYLLGLDVAFFVVVAFVRIPSHAKQAVSTKELEDVEAAPAEHPGAEAEAVSATVIGAEGRRREGAVEVTAEGSDAGTSASSGSSSGSFGPLPFRLPSVLAPLELLGHNASLVYLCIVAALVSLPEITLTDVSAQFALNQFDLVHTDDTSKQKLVSLLFQWPGYALLLPSFVVVGLLSKRFSALRMLRVLVPITGVLLSLPVLLRVAPVMWLVPIVGISVPLSMVVFAPLQSLITQLAPDDRVGEAMGSVGASKQVASLLSNLCVGGLVPFLLSTGMPKPLWIFYPLATASSLIAFALTFRIEVPPASKADALQEREEDAADLKPGSRRVYSCPRRQLCLSQEMSVAERLERAHSSPM